MKNIAVFGLGYVGLSNAILLAQKNNVIGFDIYESKVKQLQKNISPIEDSLIQKYLSEERLRFTAKTNDADFIKESDFVIIATPTNFDEDKNFFDTSSVESVIDQVLKINTNVTIIIKSTIPIGFTEKINKKYNTKNFLFSPEFLREGRALEDNIKKKRIIVGYDKNNAQLESKAIEFAHLLQDGAIKKDSPILLMGYTEAEAVKLFANTYLAMRVAYINELDNFAIKYKLDAKDIIDGICTDPRIGNYYNNPSFGYGGYCFPKDTRQLYANYEHIPNALIHATVESNKLRKQFISKEILLRTQPGDKIGIYRLVMKSGSDNCRSSAIFDIIKEISKHREVLIYEPTIKKFEEKNCKLLIDLTEFKSTCDLIVANRIDKKIIDVYDKVYTRDIFNRD